ncbi:MAG: hypothetical protein VYB09_06845 [Planctomycetota bacterium]|nr:hypothetical protein [Planctomycetota bacterium]
MSKSGRVRTLNFYGLPLLSLGLLLVPLAAQGQLPSARLASVYPPGGQPGQQVELTISGTDLDDVSQLQFSHPGITAAQKMREPGSFETEPQPVANTFVVTVAENVPAGNHDLRAVGKYGITNPRVFVVDPMATVTEQEPNNIPAEAQEVVQPTVLFGWLEQGTDVDYYQLAVKAGQRMIIRCQARSIDSRMDPILAVLDTEGRQIANSRGTREREPLLDFTARADGVVAIRVYDAVYRNGPEYFYRLSVGALPHVDFVFPPAGQAGGNRAFTVFGRNLPGGKPAGIQVDGIQLQMLEVTIPIPGGNDQYNAPGLVAVDSISSGLDTVAYQVATPQGKSNPVLVGITDLPPTLEGEPNNTLEKAQVLELPVDVAGRFLGERDQDWYAFQATKGEKISIDVVSERYQGVANVILLVQQVVKAAEGEEPEEVKQLAVVQDGLAGTAAFFDARTTDPAYTFEVPADGTYRVRLTDSLNMLREDVRQTYRLVIRPQQAEFRVVGVPHVGYSGVLLRKGGQAAIQVIAFRYHGFDEEIRIKATNLPAGVTASEATIGPGMTTALLELRAAAGAAPVRGNLGLVAEATIDGQVISRPGRFGVVNWQGTMQQGNNPGNASVGRLSPGLQVAISDIENGVVGLEFGDGNIVEASRAANIKLTYKRRGEFKGKLTMQAVGFPANVDAKQLVINPNTDNGEYTIGLKANTPPGTYTVYFNGTAEKVKYSRNPEAVVVAQEKKKKVDLIKAETDANAKAAVTAKTAADKAATDAATALKVAGDKKTAADKVLVDAQAAAKAASEQAAAAKAAAAKAPADEGLKTAAATAQKAADDAATKVKDAMAAVVVAEKAVVEATVIAKKADEAKEVADAKAQETADLVKEATALKTATDKLVTDTTNAAKPKDMNVIFVSSPLTIKVTPAPITFNPLPASVVVKQGEKVNVAVAMTRLYGFADQVSVTGVVPGGVAGLTFAKLDIAGGQNQGALEIAAAENATVGEHQLTVRLTLKLNNQNLTVDQPLALMVQEVTKTE